jgi:hypothetical protein
VLEHVSAAWTGVVGDVAVMMVHLKMVDEPRYERANGLLVRALNVDVLDVWLAACWHSPLCVATAPNREPGGATSSSSSSFSYQNHAHWGFVPAIANPLSEKQSH